MERITKEWDWSKNESNRWLIPTIESCFLIESWKSKGFKDFLDLGCGLGRHSIYFAQNGFKVEAVDLSEYAVNHVEEWSKRENLAVHTQICNMLQLPFEEESIDCIIAYNVIHHTDTIGFIKSLEEIKRVLKPGGELFITLLSKNTWSYKNAIENKRIDENTILRDEYDTEQIDVPHFHVDIDDIKKYFSDFNFVHLPMEQTEYSLENSQQFSTHFALLVSKK